MKKKFFILGGGIFVFCFIALTGANAQNTLYVDDDYTAATPGWGATAFAHPQEAVNAAAEGDIILVYPGTYGTRYSDCPWMPNCGCGDTNAPALIVYRANLTIRAIGTAAETIIESTHLCWSNPPAVQRSTNYAVNSIAAPNGVSVIASGVTIEGFTLRSAFAGDLATNYPNTAGIMIGGLYAGDQNHLGVTNATVKSCIILGHSGIYNWRASDTLIEGNTVRVLDSDALTNTVNGNGVVVWDGWFEGTFPPTSTGVQILNNDISTCNVDIAAGDEGKGIMFGGTDATNTTQWNPPPDPSLANGADQSGMLIQGNTICAASTGIKFWNSLGTDKLITCDNIITFTTYRVHDYGADEDYPLSTYTEEPFPCPEYQPCPDNLIVNWNFEEDLTFVQTGVDAYGKIIGYFDGITSDYIALRPDQKGTWTLGPEWYYTIGANPNDYHSAWTSFGDHTTGEGMMMIINARRPDQGAGEVIWEQTVNVVLNTPYTFSYWIALSHPDNPPMLKTLINAEEVGIQDMATPGTDPRTGAPGQWIQVKYDWFSGSAATATIQFVDVTVLAWGDDFVLDDIELCVAPYFDLGVEKACPASPVIPGQTITYEYTVTNPGSVAVTPVLSDDKAGTPVYTGGDTNGDGKIQDGEVWTFEVEYTVPMVPVGTDIVNVVTVEDEEAGELGDDINLTNNSDSCSACVSWYGFTPGYWKNHPKDWTTTGYQTDTLVKTVFTIPTELLTADGILDLNQNRKDDTLMDALGYRGGETLAGKAQILLRAAVGALLNEAALGSDFPPYGSTEELIAAVNGTLATLDPSLYIELYKYLDYWNNGVHAFPK